MSPKKILSILRKILAITAVKQAIIVSILLLTVLAFVHFFVQHPTYIHDLGRTNPWWIVAVIALNAPMIGLLVLIYATLLRMCGKQLPLKENFLLTSYSSIINFFGPLQSGPGVRAVYLKTRHNVRLRDYTLATLLYYGLFAFFSALFLLVGTRPWWQTVLALLIVASFSTYVIRFFLLRDKQKAQSQFNLRSTTVTAIIVFTFLQVVLTAITYYVELRAVNPHIHVGQAISYAGAANFALFVSLTPDAIGFRETFLYFSQHLHHVSTANILAANIIDRGAYALFLILLFLVVVSMHAKDKLHIKGLKRVVPKS